MTLGKLALNIYRTWGKKPKRTAGSWLAPLPWALLSEGRCELRVDPQPHIYAALGLPPRLVLWSILGGWTPGAAWTLEVSLRSSWQGILGVWVLGLWSWGRVWAPRGHDLLAPWTPQVGGETG